MSHRIISKGLPQMLSFEAFMHVTTRTKYGAMRGAIKAQVGLMIAYTLASAGPIITTLALAKTLPVDYFAGYSAFVALVSFTSTIWLWGNDGLVVREYLRGDGELAQTRLDSYQGLLGGLLVFALLALVVVWSFHSPFGTLTAVAVAASGIATASLNMRVALFRAQGKVSRALGHAAITGLLLPGVIIMASQIMLPAAPVLAHAFGYSAAALLALVLRARRRVLHDGMLRIREWRQSIGAVLRNGARTVPHTLALIGILAFDRVIPSATGTAEIVANIALAGIVGAVGHAGIAAITSSRLNHSYNSPVPEKRMVQTLYIGLVCVLLGVLLVTPVSALLGWPAEVTHLASVYGLAPLAAMPYAAFSSIIFVEKKEKLLTVVTPSLLVACSIGFAFAGALNNALLIPLVQASTYCLLSIFTLLMLAKWGRDRKAIASATFAWSTAALLGGAIIFV